MLDLLFVCSAAQVFDQKSLWKRRYIQLASKSNIHRFFHHASRASSMSSAEVSVYILYIYHMQSLLARMLIVKGLNNTIYL
ncbi:hypothetical protein NC651_009209 [Populus alba x Populus x berolinensis]|nr:hypothetical protein NC651_009209 [Populus alba x Populus x berolinensis]